MSMKRLQWTRQHKDWTLEDWKKVLWTDVSKFELFGNKRRMFVRRILSEWMSVNCIVPTVKHGDGTVMVRRCFGGEIFKDFVQIKGIIQKKKYHLILQKYTIPTVWYIIGQNFVLEQGNDPSSKLCTNYLKSTEEDKRNLQSMTSSS